MFKLTIQIGDRLCCSFGQDILDSLFSVIESNGTQQRYLRQLSHFILALCYVCAHTLVLFYQVITLNVSINSHNNALLTLLISNQFVEIKGSVFKKFEKENLFQLSCSDMVERFQLSVFLMIITMRNLAELGVDRLSEMLQNFDMSMLYSQLISLPTELSHLFLETVPDTFYSAVTTPFTWTLDVGTYMGLFDALIYPALIVFGTEIIVDWLKHAFITKFNQIRPSVYARYLDILCKDVVFGRHATATMDALPPVPQNNLNMSDHSAVVARRIGFASIPLACLVIRVVLQTSASLVPTCDIYSSTFLSGIGCLFNITLLICAVYTILLIAKCVCGITLIRYSKRRYAAMRIRANQQKFEASLAKKVQQKKDSTHIKSIAEASFVSLPTSPMSLHSFMAGEQEVDELMPLEIPMLDSDLVLPALSTPTHSRVSALTIQSRSRGNSDVVDTERYGGGAADKSQQRQATSNISSRRTSVLPVEVMLMREKADDEFKVQIPQNDGRLAKDEQDLIGSIKISNAEGPASLETIDRYTLFKGRIP